MEDYLTFRRMITPVIIQILFWIVAAVIVIVGLTMLVDGRGAEGILTILIGPLIARIYAEILIVLFKINDNVSALRAIGEGRVTPGPTGGAEPQPHPGPVS